MRKPKLIVWGLIAILILVVILNMIDKNSSSTIPEEETSSDTNNIIEPESHIMLDCKNKGTCHSLSGDVLITVLLVDDVESIWTKTDINEFKAVQEEATQKLLNEANTYGASLNIRINYIRCSISGTIANEINSAVVDEVLSAAGFESTETAAQKIMDTYSAKEAPFIIAVNRDGRSFAVPANTEDGFEYLVLFRQHGDYRHELFHLFGAKDFYYPEAVKAIAENYFTNSIMMTSGDIITDSLTAYLLGWTEKLSDEAEEFINATADITIEDVNEALENNTLTGTGTIRLGEGTYTGELVDGIPEGNGKIIWDNGDSYDGEWHYGAANGYGTMYWHEAETTYTGYLENWVLHGYGTCIFENGYTQSGQWENGEFIG